jgi:hypothetical protein
MATTVDSWYYEQRHGRGRTSPVALVYINLGSVINRQGDTNKATGDNTLLAVHLHSLIHSAAVLVVISTNTRRFIHVRFEVFTAVTMKNCRLLGCYAAWLLL